MNELRSYPSIFNIGHRVLERFFEDPVLVEEKIDGSQFSFGVDPVGGMLMCRSKSAQIILDAPDKMFAAGVEQVQAIAERLTPGWTYRGEYLRAPKHNVLAYGRIPSQHVMLFDIDTGDQCYLTPEEKAVEAQRLGFEAVPTIFHGKVESFEQFREIIERESCLGGVQMEGVVLKNYSKYNPDKKALMAKYVRDTYKEAHRMEWKGDKPTKAEAVDTITRALTTEARWQKAVQHLREAGKLEHDPRDIGPLLREVQEDVRRECEDLIKAKLYEWAWPQIARGVIKGFPQWYKDQLVKDSLQEVTP